MKRIFSIVIVLLAIAPVALAHVGSPNVFFEGKAGPYSVYAVIRPPAALPGIAQVSLRVQEPAIASVSLLPVMWQSGRQGSPSPVAAQRVSGETNLWSAEVWLLQPGSYTIQVNVQGSQGLGEATVPVNAIGSQGQQMKPGLRALLSVFGLLMAVGAVFIVSGLARESCLELGVMPSVRQRKHGRRWAGIAVLLLAATVAGGAVRWRKMDSAYRNYGIQKPESVEAAVAIESDREILELRRDRQSASVPSWAALVPDHGKLMHMFLIREPDFNVFAHLHPVRRDADTFALELPALPAGDYQLYGETTFENGINQTLVARVELPQPVGAPLSPPPLTTNLAGEVICGFFPTNLASNPGELVRDMDDSWHLEQTAVPKAKFAGHGLVSRLMGGYSLIFENADEVVKGNETTLRFSAFAPDGSEVALQPYMGMAGHAAVRRADGSVFAHLHPTGSFSMASQEVFKRRESSAPTQSGPAASLGSRVSFPYQFPKTGLYRLWIQVRIAGRVLTGVYDLEIK